MVNVNAPLPFNLNTNSSKQPRISRLNTRSPQHSLDMERQSVESSASASHELDDDTPRPTLNVRIVRGGSTLARGRPITRDAVAAVPDPRIAEGGESGAAPPGGEEPQLSPAAAEREAQSLADGVVRAAPILHLFVAFWLIGACDTVPYFSVPSTNVDRPERKSRLVGLHGYLARPSESKTLDRFRAVGVIKFEF